MKVLVIRRGFHWCGQVLPLAAPPPHLRGEELGEMLLMAKCFEWGCTKCGKMVPFNTNLKQNKMKDRAKRE